MTPEQRKLIDDYFDEFNDLRAKLRDPEITVHQYRDRLLFFAGSGAGLVSMLVRELERLQAPGVDVTDIHRSGVMPCGDRPAQD